MSHKQNYWRAVTQLKNNCAQLSTCQETKFPSFYLQFSQNVFLLSYIEIWSHFQNTRDSSRNLSQFAEPVTLTDSVLLLLGIRKVQVHLEYLPIPSQQQRWCRQKQQLLIKHGEELFLTHLLINPLTCVWQLWQFSLFYLPSFWCWPKLWYLKG